MEIIMGIRNFLRLDKATIEIDNNLIDATGLMIDASKDFMKVPTQGCFGYKHDALPTEHNINGNSNFHFAADLAGVHDFHC